MGCSRGNIRACNCDAYGHLVPPRSVTSKLRANKMLNEINGLRAKTPWHARCYSMYTGMDPDREKMMKRTYDEKLRQLKWTFDGAAPLAFTVPTITATDPTADTALVHGYTQKIGDAAAIPKNETTGKSATDAEKRAAMAEIVDRLLDGEWNGDRKGGGLNIDALVAAIVKVTKKSDAGVRAFVESRDDNGKKALRDSAQFAAAYALAVAAARPKKEIDAALKSELDAIK